MATTYKIGHLRDIFNLPSYEHMERCLGELPRLMLQARATNDMIAELAQIGAKEKGQALEIPNGRAVTWPETVDWIDDDKGVMTTKYMSGEEVLMEMKTSPAARSGERK
jgi:hypothetical protein